MASTGSRVNLLVIAVLPCRGSACPRAAACQALSAAKLAHVATPAASSPSPQRRLPDGPGLIPDRPPGRRPAPADGTNRRRLLTRARKAPNFVSADGPRGANRSGRPSLAGSHAGSHRGERLREIPDSSEQRTGTSLRSRTDLNEPEYLHRNLQIRRSCLLRGPRCHDRGSALTCPPPDCRRIVIRLRGGIKDRCFRRATSTGESAWLSHHANRSLTPSLRRIDRQQSVRWGEGRDARTMGGLEGARRGRARRIGVTLPRRFRSSVPVTLRTRAPL